MINNISGVDVLHTTNTALLNNKFIKMSTSGGLTQNTTTLRSYITCSRITPDSNTINSNDCFDILNANRDEMRNRSRERVAVQHLATHTKLRNNCWNNFHNFYNNSNASSAYLLNTSEQNGVIANANFETRTVNNINFNNNNNDNYSFNQNHFNNNNNNNNAEVKSAFNLEKSSSKIFKQIHSQSNHLRNDIKTNTVKGNLVPRIQRNEDQEYAYRCIESVHNYAKLSPPQRGQGNSSLQDDDGDCDDVGDDDDYNDNNNDDDDDDDDDDNDGEGVSNEDDGDDDDDDETDIIDDNVDYEQFFNKRKQKLHKSIKNNCHTNPQRSAGDEDIDVETIESSATSNHIRNVTISKLQPDHHARRPMNAFLIFCKRHRTIVKERYRNLENRAITKILGDWWASLDPDDKKCFVQLAQENKDAFFSANPNFKWYKLPAPPLRTLNIRPENHINHINGENVNYHAANLNNNNNNNNNNNRISKMNANSSNYFKLADEAEMGDLSTLIVNNCDKNANVALQKALGETSEFLNIHIPDTNVTSKATSKGKQLKRSLTSYDGRAVGNRNEDDNLVPKKKSARTCKGKIYQELINSGQIAPLVKKSKSTTRLIVDMQMLNEHSSLSSINTSNNSSNRQMLNTTTEFDSSIHQNSNCGLGERERLRNPDTVEFDLDERIKELPALNLDDYLQRKRNTKKKKKLSAGSNKRKYNKNTTNKNNNNSNNNKIMPASITGILIKTKDRKTITNAVQQVEVQQRQQQQQMQQLQQKPQQQQPQQQQQQNTNTVVGSQKRKARKESITRRDVSSIENEVLTINDCGFVQPAIISPTALQHSDMLLDSKQIEISMDHLPSTATTAIETTPAAMSQLISSTNINEMSSTSDLLILAEVASNRTELKH